MHSCQMPSTPTSAYAFTSSIEARVFRSSALSAQSGLNQVREHVVKPEASVHAPERIVNARYDEKALAEFPHHGRRVIQAPVGDQVFGGSDLHQVVNIFDPANAVYCPGVLEPARRLPDDFALGPGPPVHQERAAAQQLDLMPLSPLARVAPLSRHPVHTQLRLKIPRRL